jgi:NAD-dependent DNA ligase
MKPDQLRQFRFVKALMFIGHAYKLEIGEKKARALAEKFVNLNDLAMASVNDVAEVEGYGKNSARKLLNALRGGEDE